MNNQEQAREVASQLLIKGMKMPKNCGECQLRDSWICFAMGDNVGGFDKRDERCPLVEVPPHGRLIDADALMKKIEHDTPLSAVFEKTMRRYLHNAPTIIEAEEKP